jgi:uncharacterized membrane protein YeiB
MELEEIKNVWDAMEDSQKDSPFHISEQTLLTYNRKMSFFRKGEIFGLLLAYALAGLVLYHFASFNDWTLRISGYVLIIYLLAMPIYTMVETWKMKHIDLAQSNCKNVLEQIYTAKNNLKNAEKISFVASPFLFVASILILTKIITGKNLQFQDIHFPFIVLLGLAFLGTIYFNIWAFKKRDKEFKSMKQLLDDKN